VDSTPVDDEPRRDEHDAREHLIEAEVEAQETLEGAERLEKVGADDARRNDAAAD
jgi:hypothetical protein